MSGVKRVKLAIPSKRRWDETYLLFAQSWQKWANEMAWCNGMEFNAEFELMPTETDKLEGWKLINHDTPHLVVPWLPSDWVLVDGQKPMAKTCRCDIIQIWNTGTHNGGCPDAS